MMLGLERFRLAKGKGASRKEPPDEGFFRKKPHWGFFLSSCVSLTLWKRKTLGTPSPNPCHLLKKVDENFHSARSPVLCDSAFPEPLGCSLTCLPKPPHPKNLEKL